MSENTACTRLHGVILKDSNFRRDDNEHLKFRVFVFGDCGPRLALWRRDPTSHAMMVVMVWNIYSAVPERRDYRRRASRGEVSVASSSVNQKKALYGAQEIGSSAFLMLSLNL
jgi:hypothetical protein